MNLSITAEIARFAVALPPEPSRDALAVARLSLMDWLSVSLAGLHEPVARMVQGLVEEEAGRLEATAFGLKVKLPARAAALANGTLSHALDYDDTHFAYVGHPSVAVFPAALAMAEREGKSANAMLEAALMGMEAACRIGHWLGTQHYNHGFHQTATAGCFGATVAAGRLLGLSEERMRHALGLATTRASGLKSQFGTFGKPFNAGIAAANGVEAALLAARGFISRPDGLECIQGFGETHAGECADAKASLADLGKTWWFEAVQHKFHACCHGLHGALDALNRLRNQPDFALDRIEAVHLRVSPRWLRVCNIPSPETGLEAKFSYRLTTAMALCGLDTGRLDLWSEETCRSPGLIALRDRVHVIGDADIPDTAGHVRLAGGNHVMEAMVDLDAPMPLHQRLQRIIAKINALLSPDQARTVISLEESLDTMSASALAAMINEFALKRRAAS